MNVILFQHSTAYRFSAANLQCSFRSHLCSRAFSVRSTVGIPFSEDEAKYFDHLQAAVDVVERACYLCADVQKSLFSTGKKILEKMDQTPVTIADFGVQALVSLEMSKLFPSIPLVAEEDSAFLRENNLVNAVVDVLSDRLTFTAHELSQEDVLEAIDRGGKDAYLFGPKPATYWILDPIDGTRGFVKGGEALYVVGLALVVEGEIVLGVMGCPNWQDEQSHMFITEGQQDRNLLYRSGIIMISHVGCGTWKKNLWDSQIRGTGIAPDWTRCFVDGFSQVHEARFCISDSQKWESLPLSAKFKVKTNTDCVGENQIVLLPTCCGSLCKYLMVSSGRASVFTLRTRISRIIKAWDHAVGIICVHEAGGKVTDWSGNSLDFGEDKVERRALFPAGGILATNGSLHEPILELISLN